LVNDIGLEIERHTSGLNGDTTFLLVLASIGGADLASLFLSNNTGFGNERVGQGRFTVIDVSNDRDVTDVILITHDLSDLVDSEVWHLVLRSV